ncbi:cysteine dioxygenase family protein [Paraburkholderia rhizosphaerae]|uniref:Putative metal-dependent enzyme (Double-stranded beta helix superfamily) n=1 Tax=Paraburkholderia rhizosphaerae TaxID=480658 RepID=A0A4R8LKC5_9BURK|nr:cysteine dioxygenase family protein [Paraburkholderia rhizosphaerae]TDY42971.1 putative metal-dependent enzyme (double-stranded beta helix superfamily) [Paraburkholderia rhizosphaerae]
MRDSIHPLNADRHGKHTSRCTAASNRMTLSVQPAPCAAHAIERLRAALDAAFDAAFDACRQLPDPSHDARFARAVRTALVEAAADPHLLAPAHRVAAAEKYQRHLLAADPLGRYAIASLVWLPGQMSPVHAHHTWCGYVVLDGTLSEAIYEWNETEDYAVPLRTRGRDSGAVSYTRAGRGCIHRLGNASEATAISLHVYGVPDTQFATHVNDVVRCADHAESTPRDAIAAVPA